MRVRQQSAGVTVQTIAGSHVVLVGMDATEEARRGLLGFAIERTDHTENEKYFLKGFRTFQEVEPDPRPGTLVASDRHPLQTFLWGDYTAKPDHDYTYRVIPMRGTPAALVAGQAVSVRVQTESEDKGKHAVFFNRGVIGSQAYTRKFGNVNPLEVPERKALKWLSRGLEEALLKFIAKAKDDTYALRAAVYEFSYEPVLEAFKEAARKCGDVKIVYDARPGSKKPVNKSDEVIDKVKIRRLMKRRVANPSYIAHNKFIILLKNGKPVEVWTGSTNLTASGIFGHSNAGHIVRDANLARQFLDYWERLAADTDAKDLREQNMEATPDPEGPPAAGITPLFSPRKGLGALEWYASTMDSAKETVCFTAAFGVNKILSAVFAEDKDFLRFVLLEKPGDTFEDLKKDSDVRISIGAFLAEDFLSRWVAEQENRLSVHVKYIHTKYMLIDPLSTDPVVITGSANFSDASTTKNDENMLVIRGDTRVADIYLGEFTRLFEHFLFRRVASRLAGGADAGERERAFLKPDSTWTDEHYNAGSWKAKRRKLFAGTKAAEAGEGGG